MGPARCRQPGAGRDDTGMPLLHAPSPRLRPGLRAARRGLHPDRRQWAVEHAHSAERHGRLVPAAVDRLDRVLLFRRHADRLPRRAAHHRAGGTHPRVLGVRRGVDRDDAAAPALPRSGLPGRVIRAVTGFCFAGLYAAIESWMHDKADNVVRGRVLAIYQIVHYAGSAVGQQAIRFVIPASFVPFSIVAMRARRSRSCRSPGRAPIRPSRRRYRGCGWLAVPHLAGRRGRRARVGHRQRHVLVARAGVRRAQRASTPAASRAS